MKKMLDNNVLAELRTNGIISKDEVAYVHGDICIAENVISGNKRIIEVSAYINESNSSKKLLRG